MIYGIDMDGVVADYQTGFNRVLYKVTGRTVPMEHKSWDWPLDYGYTKEEIKATEQAIHESSTFWRELPSYPETDTVMFWLRKRWVEGDDIYFLTSRKGVAAKDQSVEWLDQFNAYVGGGVPNPTVIVSKKKGLICKALDVDYFLDDKPSFCIDVALESPRTACYLLDRPWNQGFEDQHVTRVKSVVGFADGV
jgi:5'(3')-deoxyribonucleotidase